MAVNSQSSRGIACFGKLFLDQIRSTGSSRSPSLALIRRAVHVSVYDKNVDDQVRPSVVPDDVIEPQSEKYWAPHPKTGVFGPETELNPSAGGARSFQSSAENGGEDSVLEKTAFFRPLENLEKPLNP